MDLTTISLIITVLLIVLLARACGSPSRSSPAAGSACSSPRARSRPAPCWPPRSGAMQHPGSSRPSRCSSGWRTSVPHQAVEEMFRGLAPWLGRVPGRLLHVNVLGCGIFGSVSGSSAATCATIAKIALPELNKRGYPEHLSLGSLAARARSAFSSRPRSPWSSTRWPPRSRSFKSSSRVSCRACW